MNEARARGRLEPVGPLLQRLLHQLGLDRHLAEYRAVEAWAEVVGPTVAAQARAVAVRDGVLFVDVTSNVWMQELVLLRDSIADRLNAHLGAPLVRKVVLSIERRALSEAPPRQREEEEPND